MKLIILAAVVAVALMLGVLVWRRKRPVLLKTDEFQAAWKELQKLLRDKAKWAEAVLNADKLLDEALKKKHVGGRSQGERLVKAQRLFTDNDGVWFGHKLRSKIDADPTMKLKEADVKQALLGIRQALKDVGALPNGQPADS
jgi:hypothetical protein